MYNRHSSKVIQTDKANLLEVLQKNRRKHQDTFIEAMKGYREAMVKELQRKGGLVGAVAGLATAKYAPHSYKLAIIERGEFAAIAAKYCAMVCKR